MSAARLVLEIQRRAKKRKAGGGSDRFELEIATSGHMHRGTFVGVYPGENFVEIADDRGDSTFIILDQITSVRPIWP